MIVEPAPQPGPTGSHNQLPESTASERFPHVNAAFEYMWPKQQHAVNVETIEENTMASPTSSSRGKLIFCFLGIFVSYFIYGILQEKITRGKYGVDEDKFTHTLALVFCQCIINSIFARIAITITKSEQDTTPPAVYALMTMSYVGAMLASNHALQWVSYPTQVLGKSVKPIPVMILGVLVARKRYPLQKYLFVLMIVAGVALFIYKDKKGAALDSEHLFGWGEALLLISLALDGMTGGLQDRIRGQYKTQTYTMMLACNIWSVLYLFVGLLLTGEGLEFVLFVTKHPQVIFDILTFSVCSAVGQSFIFLTVTSFGPLTCSIFTTTRKFFTILASVLIFAHPMSGRQWLGTLFVFIGLSLDSAYGKERKTDKKPAKQ